MAALNLTNPSSVRPSKSVRPSTPASSSVPLMTTKPGLNDNDLKIIISFWPLLSSVCIIYELSIYTYANLHSFDTVVCKFWN